MYQRRADNLNPWNITAQHPPPHTHSTIGWQKDISSKKRYCCYTLPKIKQNSLSIVACVYINTYMQISVGVIPSVCVYIICNVHIQLNLQEYFAELHTNEFFKLIFSRWCKSCGEIFWEEKMRENRFKMQKHISILGRGENRGWRCMNKVQKYRNCLHNHIVTNANFK